MFIQIISPGHSTPDAASLPSPTTLSPSSAGVGRGDEEEERRRRRKQQDGGGGGRVKDIRGMFEKDFNPLPEYGSVSPARSVSPAPPPPPALTPEAGKENGKKGGSLCRPMSLYIFF